MKKTFISILFVLMLFAVPIILFLKPAAGILADEQRDAANFPKKLGGFQSANIHKYFGEIDKFVTDNFPERQQLIGFNRNIFEVLHDNVDTNKSFWGKENWLFLGNDYNNIVNKMMGKTPLSQSTIQRRSTHIQDYIKAFRAYGVEPIVLIGPNKSTIYPEYLPALYQPSPKRFIDPIIDQLRKDGVDVYDPVEDLKKIKSKSLIYYKTDTHWNLKGSEFVALNLLKKWHLNPPPPYELQLSQSIAGDLTRIANLKKFPLEDGDNFVIKYTIPIENAKYTRSDGTVRPIINGRIIATDDVKVTNPSASNQTDLWIIGDSFSEGLQPFLIPAISDIQIFHIRKISLDDIVKRLKLAKEKPKFALIVIVERNM